MASSPPLPHPSSRSLSANSPGGASGDIPFRRRISPTSTPSLSKISTSPRRRDSRVTVSPLSFTEIPGGGVAVPIFSAFFLPRIQLGAAPHLYKEMRPLSRRTSARSRVAAPACPFSARRELTERKACSGGNPAASIWRSSSAVEFPSSAAPTPVPIPSHRST